MWFGNKRANKYIQTVKSADSKGLYTALHKQKKLTLSKKILKEHRICSVSTEFVVSTQILWGGKEGEETAP